MSGLDLQMPPGFRFHPTDEELVSHYLCRKCAALPIAVPIIAEIDLYKYEPWLLPGMAFYGEKEWYFFSPRDRKYPNGSRPNRAAGMGYWKATGADKPIGTPKPMAIKKALVFYSGKAPKGEKTNWIMHEYRLADVDRTARRKNSLRLDDWVLCRIYNKKGSVEKQLNSERKAAVAGVKGARLPLLAGPNQKPELMLHVPQPPTFAPHVPQMMDLMCFDTSDSLPRLHADSSCSEHVLSPEFATCEREVQSRPRWREWNRALEVVLNNDGATAGGSSMSLQQYGSDGGISPGFPNPLQDIFLQDIFSHLQKPF